MPTASTLQEVAREHIKINAKGKGGNTKFTCNHCKREFTGSQTRQLAHLTGTSGSGVAACQHIDGDLRKAIKTEVDRLERVKSGSQASSSHINFSVAEQRPAKRIRQPTIAESLADKKALDTVVAEFFYAHGVPLHLVRSPLFKKMYLLDAVKCHVEKDNASWSDHGKNVTGFVLGSDRQ
ncbi:hypothetical protein WJX79_000903 [Trebouxia sp. C0005]